ncbi:hypothetical protein GCM10022222_03240 [Amycolatopsis ultiminotia]|uniref:Uncharacterized protein n=1 Tax=Amycolatopsis ultiminotia TaxID=543629 RepID=A0ABP6UWV9_9PSEU
MGTGPGGVAAHTGPRSRFTVPESRPVSGVPRTRSDSGPATNAGATKVVIRVEQALPSATVSAGKTGPLRPPQRRRTEITRLVQTLARTSVFRSSFADRTGNCTVTR